MKLAARLSFWAAFLITVIGFPACFFFTTAEGKPGRAGLPAASVAQFWPVPVLSAALAVLYLYLARNETGRTVKNGRQWALAIIMGSMLLGVYMFAGSAF